MTVLSRGHSKTKNFLTSSHFSSRQLVVFALVFAFVGAFVLWHSFAANPTLPGDINNDGAVNVTDLSIILTNFGTTNVTVDLNNNGKVDITDLSILLSHYGQTRAALPTPAPTVTLSASPKSVTAGQSTTLTWNSTDATVCTAAGAWSGARATLGSISTGALNTNSTFSLTCTGAGGFGSASTVVSVAAAPPPVSSGRLLGFSSHIPSDLAGADAYVAKLATANIRAVRDDLAWSWTENPKGTFNWTRLNTLCTVTRKYNMKLVVQIGFAPGWSNGGRQDKIGPYNASDFGNWAKAVALKLQQTCPDTIRGIEYWNEPNINFLINPNTGQEGDPIYYTQLANAAYTAIKGAGVTIPLWGGSTSGVGQTVWNGPIDWTETTLKNGVKFDEWSCHAYYFGTGITADQTIRMDVPTGFNMTFFYGGLETLDKLLARYGYSGKIHSTEMGMPTDAYPSGTRINAGGFGSTTEAVQADWFTKAWPLWISKPRAGDFYIYTSKDNNSGDTTDREDHFGSFRSDWSEKPIIQRTRGVTY